MTDPAERFIEAAVRPLADNAEMQMLAAQELRAAMERGSAGVSGDSLAQATANLERARPKERWKVILYAVALIAAALAAIPVARDYARYRLASWTLFSPYDSPWITLPGLPLGPDAKRRMPGLLGPLTASERLLLFGDLSQPSQVEAMRRLWDSSPEDPALFADYTRACTSKRTLPVDFLKTADRLDPQNGWFRYLVAAGITANKSVEPTNVPYHVFKRNPDVPRFRVLNPAAHADAIRLFEEASRLPVSNSYREELLLRRLEILPPGNDLLERSFTRAYLSDWVPRAHVSWGNLSLSISARAEELAAAGDREGFQSLADAWEIFARRSIGDGDMGSDPFGPVPAMARAARILGMEPQAARYSRLESATKMRKEEQSQGYLRFKEELRGHRESAIRTLEPGTRVAHPPVVDRSEIMPGVMATRSAWQRVASAGAGVVILAAFVLAACARWVRGFQARRLSASLVQILGPSDCRRIIIGGVVIPVLVHTLAEWLIPTVFHPYTRDPREVAFLRFGALTAAILTLPALLAHRKLGLHLERLGWEKTSLAAVAASAAMTAFAAASGHTRSMPAEVMGWAFVIVLSGLISINLIFGVLTTPRRHALQFLTWTRSLLPAYATGLLLLAFLVPIHHARERHWTKLNFITKIEPGIPATNRHQHEVENHLKKELLELLDAKP